PDGWQPDCVCLYLPYTKIPAWLWPAPVPIVGLAADWNLLWHHYRNCLRQCDLVLTDAQGVEVMKRSGIEHVRQANLFGLERGALDPGSTTQEMGTGTLNPRSQSPFPAEKD